MNHNILKGYPLIIRYLSIFLMMIGFIILLPLLNILFYPNELNQAIYFILPGVTFIFIGFFSAKIFKGQEIAKLDKHQDAVLILFIWIIAILCSSLPFLLTGQYNFSQSVFESTSGYSTTGLTVVDVTVAPKIFLLYRSLLQFFGGVGLVLVLTSAVSDRHGMRLYSAEGHNDKLLPNLIRSARLILSIYIGYVLVGSTLYVIYGMTPFDAFNHAIASVSTGGFSTKASSIGYYKSFEIEIVTMILMLLGSTNLVIHILLIKGKFKKSMQHIELKLLLALLLLFVPLMIISIRSFSTMTFFEGMRYGLFQFMTAITTTGFQTVDSFQNLPHFFNLSVILLMIIGGGIGSTAGGIKQYRIALSIKHLFWNIRNRISNKKTLHTDYTYKYGKEFTITPEDISSNNAHITLYLITLLVGTFIFTAFGYSFRDALFEFSSALGTVGLSIGVIGYNSHPVMLWTASLGMFLGRLEFFVVIIGLSKLYLDISHKKVL